MAESFGADAVRYDRARPRYPVELVEAVVAASPGTSVLDVGIGTGIAARQFRSAGCAVTGVDVDPRMAEFARQQGFAVDVAAFEQWDSGGRVFDAVVAGQAWHWVDPVAGARKAASVLRPGGRLAVFWNVARPPEELAAAFADVYRRVVPGWPVARGGASPLEGIAVDGMRAVERFGEPERWQYDWEFEYDRDSWLDFVPTSGGHSRFSERQLAEVLAGVADAVDAVGGRFTMHYSAVVLTAALG